MSGPGWGGEVPEEPRRVRGWMRPWVLVPFLLFYAWELLLSNLHVALQILSPAHRMSPGVIGCRLRCATPLEVTFLANLITLTPGTLSLDVDREGRVLYVHGLHVRDPDEFRRDIARLEDRLLKVLR